VVNGLVGAHGSTARLLDDTHHARGCDKVCRMLALRAGAAYFCRLVAQTAVSRTWRRSFMTTTTPADSYSQDQPLKHLIEWHFQAQRTPHPTHHSEISCLEKKFHALIGEANWRTAMLGKQPLPEDSAVAYRACADALDALRRGVQRTAVGASQDEWPDAGSGKDKRLLPLNDALGMLGQLLNEVGPQTAPVQRAKVEDPGDPMWDFEMGAELRYVLAENDPAWRDGDENFVACRDELCFKDSAFFCVFGEESDFNDRRGPHDGGDGILAVPHCWLFHDLYDHACCVERKKMAPEPRPARASVRYGWLWSSGSNIGSTLPVGAS
jgi:hypothetical protein